MLKHERPLRVAILSSRRAPGLLSLLADPRRGENWDLVGLLATDEEFEESAQLEAAGVPLIVHPIHAFYSARGRKIRDRSTRRDYDRETLELVRVFHPELLLLSGYLYVLTETILAPFHGRIVNVHGSDLTRLEPHGLPRYLGLRAVADSIFAGERETRATAHWVTEEVDLGPPILRSRPFPVSPLAESARRHGDAQSLKAYAFAHQEWMLREAWGPLLKGIISLIATRRVAFGGGVGSGHRVALWDLSEHGGLCQTNQAVRAAAVC